MKEIKNAIITIAGSSSRFSKSVNRIAHKSLELVPALGMSLLEWQIKTLCDNGIHKIIVVTGFMQDKVNAELDKLCMRHKMKINRIHNYNYNTYGSVESMILGMQMNEALTSQYCLEKPTSILCIEGDLYCSNLGELVQTPFDHNFSIRPTTNCKSIIRADRDVVGICKTDGRIEWKYSDEHKCLQLNYEPAKFIFNSAQIWEINTKDFDYQRFNTYLTLIDHHKNNLQFINYFSNNAMEPFELKDWVNANTIEDLLSIKCDF